MQIMLRRFIFDLTKKNKMNFPEDVRYTKEHEWIRLEENGEIAVVGITDFAQSELGDIVYIEVETVGETLKAESVFGTIEAVKTTSDLFMPLEGKVIEVNHKIISGGEDHPELVNSHPYGDGWIVKIQLTHPEKFNSLLTHTTYKELVH